MRFHMGAEPLRVFHLFQLSPSADQLKSRDEGDQEIRTALMRARFGQIDEAIRLDMFRHAASLNARSEDDVFYKTRSLGGRPWQEGERIILTTEHAQETDVGDIVIDMEAGEAWMCATFGWEALSWDRCAHFLQYAAELSLPASWTEDEVSPEPEFA